MTDVSRLLAERLDVELDASDYEPTPEKEAPVSTDELIAGLRAVGAALAAGNDLDPPTRLRHSWAIDQAVARLRQLG